MWFFPKLYLSYVRDRACYTMEALQQGPACLGVLHLGFGEPESEAAVTAI